MRGTRYNSNLGNIFLKPSKAFDKKKYAVYSNLFLFLLRNICIINFPTTAAFVNTD